jgi:nucleoside-diphosphate-sugar epimerase
MKVAVTGAAGFIGRHVLAELETKLVETLALVRPSKENACGNYKCTFVQFDLHNAPYNAYDLLGRPDVLIHLAWSDLSNVNSLHHFEQELPAQYRFLKNFIESGLQTLVVAGSCFEYGMHTGLLSENIDPQPCTAYGFAKNALRCQLEYLKTECQFNFVWARLFYLYGEGQSESSLLPKIKSAVARGDQLFNMSSGEQLRDYLPVAIAAKYLVSLALAEKDNGIVNVCSGIPISIRELVEGWIKKNGWAIRLNLGYYPDRDYEPKDFWGDPNKIKLFIQNTT